MDTYQALTYCRKLRCSMLQYGASQIKDVNMHQLGVGQSVKLKIENVH